MRQHHPRLTAFLASPFVTDLTRAAGAIGFTASVWYLTVNL